MKRFHDLAVDHLDLLLVVGGAERRGHERLRLASREHGRAVRAGKQADLDRDRANLVERAAVEPLPALERLVAHHLFLELLEDPFASARRSGSVSGMPASRSARTLSTLA